jgi:hypothetical protein
MTPPQVDTVILARGMIPSFKPEIEAMIRKENAIAVLQSVEKALDGEFKSADKLTASLRRGIAKKLRQTK